MGYIPVVIQSSKSEKIQKGVCTYEDYNMRNDRGISFSAWVRE
jgi:hypothetical protein